MVQNFYDNNREKIGKKINGIPVISPQEKSKKDFIIITTTWADEVWHELTAASFKLNEDFIIMKY